MGKRLSKIYTKTGDKGETGLGDGSRIPKDHIRVQAMGSCDELNSHLGLVISELKSETQFSEVQFVALTEFIEKCQHRIFDLGGEISIPGFKIVNDDHVEGLERYLDELNADIPPLENFIMPAGSRLLATIHLARSVARRAERDLVSLSLESDQTDSEINEAGLRYLNRLSDFLFVAARFVAKESKIEEVLWQQGYLT